MLITTKFSEILKNKIFRLLLFVLHITAKKSQISTKFSSTSRGLTQIIQQSNQLGDTSIIRPKSSAQFLVHMPCMWNIAGRTFKYSYITNKLYV